MAGAMMTRSGKYKKETCPQCGGSGIDQSKIIRRLRALERAIEESRGE